MTRSTAVSWILCFSSNSITLTNPIATAVPSCSPKPVALDTAAGADGAETTVVVKLLVDADAEVGAAAAISLVYITLGCCILSVCCWESEVGLVRRTKVDRQIAYAEPGSYPEWSNNPIDI